MRVVEARTGPVHQAPSPSRPTAEVLIDQDAGGGVPQALDPAGNSQWVPAGPLDQLADDTAVHVDLAGHPVCLARSGGSVHALLDECSHERVALSDGDIANGQVECWLHGSRFDLTTGAPTGPPAIRPVPVYPVRITGGGIEVAVPARSGGAAHG
ncbi:MAG: non-heme iron oxygenase ferredoxin subunit [Mycobacteriales bacterium]